MRPPFLLYALAALLARLVNVNDLLIIDSGLVLVLGTYVFEVRAALLAILVIAAIVFDVRSRRIPNGLVLTGLIVAVAFHLFHSSGWGFLYALKGAAVGLGLFLPLYIVRALGAGDVKLMAAVGAFLGPVGAIGAVLMTLLAGGVLALAVAVWKGALPAVLANTRFILNHAAIAAVTGAGSSIPKPATSTLKLPYAIAIAAGTFTQLLLVNSGRALIG